MPALTVLATTMREATIQFNSIPKSSSSSRSLRLPCEHNYNHFRVILYSNPIPSIFSATLYSSLFFMQINLCSIYINSVLYCIVTTHHTTLIDFILENVSLLFLLYRTSVYGRQSVESHHIWWLGERLLADGSISQIVNCPWCATDISVHHSHKPSVTR